MAFSHGKFRSTGEKGPKPAPVEKSMDKTKEMIHGKAQEPHGGGDTEEHITKTHPGATQPHHITGVHAFHAHHTGGGKFTSHTHHDGGEVETRQHDNEVDVKDAHEQAFPAGQGDMESAQHLPDDGFGESLGGIGGNMPSEG
jgi:hypothetical protein